MSKGWVGILLGNAGDVAVGVIGVDALYQGFNSDAYFP